MNVTKKENAIEMCNRLSSFYFHHPIFKYPENNQSINKTRLSSNIRDLQFYFKKNRYAQSITFLLGFIIKYQNY